MLKKTSTSHRRGASAARKAHNLEVTGSTPVAGIISLRSFYRIEPSSWTLNVALHSFTRRCSSAEERLTPSPSFSTPFRGGPIWGWLSAHNREVVGSKPTTGNSFHSIPLPLVAQRQSAVNTVFFLSTFHLSLGLWLVRLEDGYDL